MMVAPYKIMKTQTEYLYLTIQTKFDKYNAQEYNMFYFFGFISSTSVSQNSKLMLYFRSTGCTPPPFSKLAFSVCRTHFLSKNSREPLNQCYSDLLMGFNS